MKKKKKAGLCLLKTTIMYRYLAVAVFGLIFLLTNSHIFSSGSDLFPIGRYMKNKDGEAVSIIRFKTDRYEVIHGLRMSGSFCKGESCTLTGVFSNEFGVEETIKEERRFEANTEELYIPLEIKAGSFTIEIPNGQNSHIDTAILTGKYYFVFRRAWLFLTIALLTAAALTPGKRQYVFFTLFAGLFGVLTIISAGPVGESLPLRTVIRSSVGLITYIFTGILLFCTSELTESKTSIYEIAIAFFWMMPSMLYRSCRYVREGLMMNLALCIAWFLGKWFVQKCKNPIPLMYCLKGVMVAGLIAAQAALCHTLSEINQNYFGNRILLGQGGWGALPDKWSVLLLIVCTWLILAAVSNVSDRKSKSITHDNLFVYNKENLIMFVQITLIAFESSALYSLVLEKRYF